MAFTEKNFNIGVLQGISEKSMEEHKKLYSGYVKHANLILEKIKTLSENQSENAYLIGELRRRFGFEFDGIRNHEYFFEQFEGGSHLLDTEGMLAKQIITQWRSIDAWLAEFKALALTRGIGWAFLYFDETTKQLVHAWIDEQHLGHLTGLKVILALDMWEHSYLFDYVPAEKKAYIDAFFSNLNYSIVESRFNS